MRHRVRRIWAATGFCAFVASVASVHAEPACGESITKNTTLSADLECAADGVTVAAPGVVLDCDGHAIRGSGGKSATGIRVAGMRGVALRNCTVSGFDTAVRLFDAPSFRLTDSNFADNGTGVYAERSPKLRVERSSFAAEPFHLLLRHSPEALVRGNRFEPGKDGRGALSFNRSPRAQVLKNESAAGAGVDLFAESDDAVVSGNDLGDAGEIAIFVSSRATIAANRIGRASGERRDGGFAIRLTGSDQCLVRDNTLAGRGIFLMSFDGETPSGEHERRGSDRNRIQNNVVRASAYGVYDFGGSGNDISANEMTDVLLGVLLAPARGDEESLGFGCAGNVVRGNRFEGGQMGIQSSDAANNQILENRIRHQDVGLLDLRTDLIGAPQNVLRANVFEENRIFGLVAYGSSPVIAANDFRRNGDRTVALPAELETVLGSVEEARGAIALLPFVGWQGGSFDDGDPGNDLLATPRIGGEKEHNRFRQSSGADIFALDTRPDAAATLATDNDFDAGGEAARFRQDWFGLVRVIDEEGFPVTGADVIISDAMGEVVAKFPSGEGGFASAEADPDRPMGLLPIELGGPVPPWTRFTEYVVARDGKRVGMTPHRISVRSDGRQGRACYTWDGHANDRSDFHIASERYQTAVVKLSEADWSSCHASALVR